MTNFDDKFLQNWRETVNTQFQTSATVVGFGIASLAIISSFASRPFALLEKRFFAGAVTSIIAYSILVTIEAHYERRAAYLYLNGQGSDEERIKISKRNNCIHFWTQVASVLSLVVTSCLIVIRIWN